MPIQLLGALRQDSHEILTTMTQMNIIDLIMLLDMINGVGYASIPSDYNANGTRMART